MSFLSLKTPWCLVASHHAGPSASRTATPPKHLSEPEAHLSDTKGSSQHIHTARAAQPCMATGPLQPIQPMAITPLFTDWCRPRFVGHSRGPTASIPPVLVCQHGQRPVCGQDGLTLPCESQAHRQHWAQSGVAGPTRASCT